VGTVSTSEVWVIIPAQNEAESIAEIVRRARGQAHKVVVVDDASTDDTARLAREAGACVLPLVTPLDAWCATQTGLRYAHAQGARLVVTLDADGQHPPEAIPELTRPILAGEAEVVIGSDPARVSGYRHAAWHYLRGLTGLKVADLTSGYRAYGPEALETLIRPEASSLNYQDIGVLMMLRESGLRMAEVPVPMSPRLYGASHVFCSWMKVAAYMLESSVIGLARRANA
jgi:glycosyltransferase involved in cell wall biosynthesis